VYELRTVGPTEGLGVRVRPHEALAARLRDHQPRAPPARSASRFATARSGSRRWTATATASRREFTRPADLFDKLDLDKDRMIRPEEAEKYKK
jgi:hypothetical protein